MNRRIPASSGTATATATAASALGAAPEASAGKSGNRWRTRAWGYRLLGAAALGVGVIAATATPASAASSHQFIKGRDYTFGEAWFNSGTCCIAQRNAFTVKDWVTDDYEIHVQWKGARSGSRGLVDGRNREHTFSIETANVTRAAIQWRACVVDVISTISKCNGWTTDYID